MKLVQFWQLQEKKYFAFLFPRLFKYFSASRETLRSTLFSNFMLLHLDGLYKTNIGVFSSISVLFLFIHLVLTYLFVFFEKEIILKENAGGRKIPETQSSSLETRYDWSKS